MEQKFTCPLFGIISGAFMYSHADFFSWFRPPSPPPPPPNQCGTLAELAKKSEFKSQGKRRGEAEKDTGVGRREKKREADGYCKLNWLGEGSDFHCDEPE